MKNNRITSYNVCYTKLLRAVEHNCACLTSLDTAKAFASSVERGLGQVLEPLDIVKIFA